MRVFFVSIFVASCCRYAFNLIRKDTIPLGYNYLFHGLIIKGVCLCFSLIHSNQLLFLWGIYVFCLTPLFTWEAPLAKVRDWSARRHFLALSWPIASLQTRRSSLCRSKIWPRSIVPCHSACCRKCRKERVLGTPWWHSLVNPWACSCCSTQECGNPIGSCLCKPRDSVTTDWRGSQCA